MKLTIEFDGPDDGPAAHAALNAREYAAALDAVREHLRQKLKHGALTEETRTELEEVRGILVEHLSANLLDGPLPF